MRSSALASCLVLQISLCCGGEGISLGQHCSALSLWGCFSLVCFGRVFVWLFWLWVGFSLFVCLFLVTISPKQTCSAFKSGQLLGESVMNSASGLCCFAKLSRKGWLEVRTVRRKERGSQPRGRSAHHRPDALLGKGEREREKN